jgi:glucose/arabinose dehydrogenase
MVFQYVVRVAMCVWMCVWMSLGVVLGQTATAAQATPPSKPVAVPSAPVAPNDPVISYGFTTVATDLTSPIFVGHAGDERLFIVEQAGVIKIWKNGAVLDTPFLDITGRVLCCGERGLLGLAFEPNYATTRRFYVYYTDKNSATSGDIVIARYTTSNNPDVANTQETRVLTIPHRVHGNHNGGWLGFGPDNFLYAGIGDGGSGGDPDCRALNPQDLLGKLLRLNVVGQITYTAPITNMHSITSSAAPEVWAIGVRNPWRNSFDRQSGEFYIGDVGQNEWEEISTLPAHSAAGKNLGWSKREGKHDFSNGCPASAIPVTDPTAEYNHAESTVGCASVTGGYVYRGISQPWLNGNYFYGDACSGQLWAMWQPQPGSYTYTQILDTDWNIVSFGEDKQGEIYVVHHGGAIYRLASKLLLKVAYLPLVRK